VAYSTVPSENNEDGRYYTRKFYKDVSTNVLYGIEDITVNEIDPVTGLNQPWDFNLVGCNMQMWPNDKGKKQLNYKYSATGNGNDNQRDRISKLPILECELIIGNKRLVEYDMDEWGHSQFAWVDVNSGVPQTYTDENGVEQTYSKQTFSLGINPKTEGDGDYIIG
jgi:hypothetical protein